MRIERLNNMEQYILKEGIVSTENLKSKFSISLNTVKRDVDELLKRGTVKKVYGGVSTSAEVQFTSLDTRTNKNIAEKKVIGELCADLIPDGSSVFVDSGSTAAQLISFLSRKSGITIFSHNIQAVSEAAKYPNLEVIVFGGRLNHETGSVFSLKALQEIENVCVDIAVISAMGLYGADVTNATYMEAEIKKHILDFSKRKFLVVDNSKFDVRSSIRFANVGYFDAVVTNIAPSREYTDLLNKENVKLFYR